MLSSPFFPYRNGQLYAEACALHDIAAQVGTPCYVYSRHAIEQQWQDFTQAFGRINPAVHCYYAVKANSNLAILNLLARLGAGFDIVSGGELQRVLRAGGEARRVVFSGVGKHPDEIRAALHAGIGCFNVESSAELQQLNQLAAECQTIAPIAIRANPDIAIDTHPYITTGLKENKFGVSSQEVIPLFLQAARLPHIRIQGIACHLGSQIREKRPYLQALDKLLRWVDELQQHGISLTHVDLGGGFGVDYQTHTTLPLAELAADVQQRLANYPLDLLLEPGRVIVASAGLLLTRVLLIKAQTSKQFAVVDAAMNDLLRPALYDAWHEILPVVQQQENAQIYDIVGPVCETGDFLAKGRTLAIQANDLLAVATAGAYGFVMSSNYNTRPRAAEVMVDNDQFYIIRQRERVEDLWASEICLS